jgi:alkaline phosphatase D
VITGDKHISSVREVPPSYLTVAGRPVATECIGTSISSGGQRDPEEYVPQPWNPQIKWEDLYRHGYVRVEATPDVWRSDFRMIDHVDREENILVWTETNWEVLPDTPGATEVTAV